MRWNENGTSDSHGLKQVKNTKVLVFYLHTVCISHCANANTIECVSRVPLVVCVCVCFMVQSTSQRYSFNRRCSVQASQNIKLLSSSWSILSTIVAVSVAAGGIRCLIAQWSVCARASYWIRTFWCWQSSPMLICSPFKNQAMFRNQGSTNCEHEWVFWPYFCHFFRWYFFSWVTAKKRIAERIFFFQYEKFRLRFVCINLNFRRYDVQIWR